MKKLSPIAYRALFFKHVWEFLNKIESARELANPHVIAVSGGIDSMVLLWFAHTLYKQGKIGEVRAVFVHHHTRTGQDLDHAFIQKFCDQEGIQLRVKHAKNLLSLEGNFEARARRERRNLILDDLAPNETLWPGHQLNDSYEWNLMQRHRSTNPRSAIGIPVRNGRIVRPFNCVTRAQIVRLAKFEGIPHREDPTNKDRTYDRNFIRHEVIKRIRQRYPKYLKFYANFANFQATMLGINVLSRGGASRIFVFSEGAVLIGKHFSETQVQEIIHDYSNTDRGEILQPIQKMFRAIDNGKKGPFHFSGGMEAYHSHNLLMIYKQNMKNYDQQIASVLSALTMEELKDIPQYKRVELSHAWSNLLRSPDAIMNMPGLVLVLEPDNICKNLNTSNFDAQFPNVSRVCQERGLRFITFTKCLEIWASKKEKLPERLRLLPLANLSNLFSSHQ